MRKQRYHRVLLVFAVAVFIPIRASADPNTSTPASQPASGSTAPTAVPFWLVTSGGQVQPFAGAADYGSVGSTDPSHPAVALAPTPDAHGYLVASNDGGVFTFGDASFHGSASGLALSSPVVNVASTPDGAGYWLVSTDGGVFTFGTAGYFGSAHGMALPAPVVDLVPTPDGGGYWLVSTDGGVLSYGDAKFYGSAAGTTLNAPVVGMTPTRDARGYWLVGRDGGVFSYGDAQFYGAAATSGQATRAIAANVGSNGYTVIRADGTAQRFGPPADSSSNSVNPVTSSSASSRVVAAGALGQTVPPVPTPGQTALNWARTQIGKPYGYASAGPDAYDCSGLTMASYRVAGITLPRTAAEQYGAGAHFPLSQAQPGDLVFWADDPSDPSTITHVGLFVGPGEVLHAPRSGEYVRIEAMWPDGLLSTVTRP